MYYVYLPNNKTAVLVATCIYDENEPELVLYDPSI